MKKLLKRMSPLAPDDSGACAVLYELGGITVICDAGGCAGNVCGFDEPRWHEKKSALFSAGLRDMDAILGRDDQLIAKLAEVCTQIDAEFTAIIGTPVPAVIATDFHALMRMAERKTGLPCITVPTDGTKYYDTGAEAAYCALFERFAQEQYPTKKGKTGILGATPLDTGYTRAEPVLRSLGCGEAVCFGMDSSLAEIRRVSECERLLVIAPSGLKAAEQLYARFGIPYTAAGIVPETVTAQTASLRDKRVLIVHQQMAANALRERLDPSNTVHCAAWFMQDRRFTQDGDFRIREEQQLAEAARAYDVIIADSVMGRVLRGFQLIDWPHFAVSGRLS